MIEKVDEPDETPRARTPRARQQQADVLPAALEALPGSPGGRLPAEGGAQVGAGGEPGPEAETGAGAEVPEGDLERARAELGDEDAGGPAADGGGGRPLAERVEAVLFASGAPLSAQRLANVLGDDLDAVRAVLAGLMEAWAQRPGAIDLVEIAGGFRFMTRPLFAPDVAGLAKKASTEKLSPAALETLAVVAYRQPINRADIEAVRGVQAGPVLRWLLERDLIRISGRSDEPGHPLLYGTTKRFLDHFGLPSLKALPDLKDILEPS